MTTPTQNLTPKPARNAGPDCAQVSGSAPFFVMVGQPRNMLCGKYLAGPTPAKDVRRNGYGFTKKWREAWPFKTRKAAEAKARIIERHMGWGEGVAIILPNPELSGR